MGCMGRELWSASTTCQDVIHYTTAPHTLSLIEIFTEIFAVSFKLKTKMCNQSEKHSCQPFRFWRNSSDFYAIFRHSERNDRTPPKLKKLCCIIKDFRVL